MTVRATSALALCLTAAALVAACKKDSPAGSGGPPAPGEYRITVTDQGFEPASLPVPKATPVTLVFTRKTDNTCAKSVVLEVAGQKIEKALPLGTPVSIPVTFPDAGTLTYACNMDMLKGTLVVQ